MNETAERNYVEEILELMREKLDTEEFLYRLSDYHDSDIADAFERLSEEERKALIPAFLSRDMSDVFSYVEDLEKYLQDLTPEEQAQVLGYLDSDDAVDVLEELDENKQEEIISMMDPEQREDVSLIMSYEEDEIGSRMTTNYISIPNTLSIKEATEELVEQAQENDNVSTIYVVDKEGKYYGAIELMSLMAAKASVPLEEIISTNYPYFEAHEKVSECIEQLKDYAEDSLPVVYENMNLLGIITAQDIVEVVDDEMGDDYAKLAGLTAEEDLHETTLESMRKRLPWLIILLLLGLGVSSVVGVFEKVVASLPIIMCFQSLILGMAGNVGTQSLAVTIRVLMDENIGGTEKVKLVFKEIKVGFCNGLLLGILTFIFIGLYILLLKHMPAGQSFLISACVGIALLAAMIVSSLVGTIVPLFFHRLGVDPAVSSGPLITTVNDLVAVITYYGLAWVLLIGIFHMA